ncbi:hypothetical protein BH23VER1_BH23VER1_02040 [soil metagenome]
MPDRSAALHLPAEPGKKRVFWQRLASTLALWALVVAAVALGNMALFFVLIAGLGMLSLVEFFAMQPTGLRSRRYRRPVIVLAALYFAAVFFRCATSGGGPFWDLDVAFSALALGACFVVTLGGKLEGEKTLLRIGITFLGFVYVPVFFSFLTKLLFIVPPVDGTKVAGEFYVVFVVVATKFTDMGAYAVGSLIGKHKMIPHISPGKTWQGFGGAIAGALVGGASIFALFGDRLELLTWSHALALSLILAPVAVVGDLAESVLKRCLGSKDSGKMLPGIGGALDLTDSILFTAPVAYVYLVLV